MSAATLTGSGVTPTPKRVHTFASLAIPNYRLFFAGGLVSNVGTWMARVAQDWLVLTQLTDNSAAALGLVTGLQFAPVALLAPFAGVLADKMSKRKLLIGTQIGLALTGLVLALLVLTGHVQLWHVYLLATLQGVVTAYDNPARQAFVPEMVPQRLLTNAVGLNSTSFNGARLIGPAVAGLTIAAWGIGPALLVNALSFVAVIVALWAMKPADLVPAPRHRGGGGLREGLRYVAGRPDIMLIMLLVFVLGTFGMNFQITNALMATQIFGVGAEMYGLLGSIMAIGSLSGALMAARRSEPRLRTLLMALLGFAVVVTVAALAPTYWFFALMLIPTGLFSLTAMTLANSSVQLATDAAMRGRVMALYMAIFLGGTPLGAPVIGWIGDAFGARWTLLVGSIGVGVTAVVVGGYLLWRRRRQASTLAADLARDAR